MARLLPLLIMLLVWLVVVLGRQAAAARPRDGRTYRPRAGGRARRGGGPGGVTMLRLRDVAGLRDAYSGEPIDPSRPLVRCGDCQSVYHADSARVLARDNGGRCAACGGTDFSAVKLTSD